MRGRAWVAILCCGLVACGGDFALEGVWEGTFYGEDGSEQAFVVEVGEAVDPRSEHLEGWVVYDAVYTVDGLPEAAGTFARCLEETCVWNPRLKLPSADGREPEYRQAPKDMVTLRGFGSGANDCMFLDYLPRYVRIAAHLDAGRRRPAVAGRGTVGDPRCGTGHHEGDLELKRAVE